MSIYLKQQIEARITAIEEARRKVELLEAELGAYEDALKHSAVEDGRTNGHAQPDVRPAPVAEPHGGHVGHWKDVVTRLSGRERFGVSDVEDVLKGMGKPTDISTIRAKVSKLLGKGTLTRVAAGTYRVAPGNN